MRIFAAALTFVAGLVAALPAAAQEAVRVRGGQHEDFGRIVFDWSQDVQYRVAVEGRRLRVEFDKQASFRTSALLPALRDYVGEPAPGPHGYRLTFPLKGDYGVEQSTYGTKVIIDLIDPESGPETLPRVRVRAGPHEDFDRLVFDWPKPTKYSVTPDRAAGQVRVTFQRAAQLDVSDYRGTPLSRVLSLTPFPGDEQVSVEIDTLQGARIRDFTLDNRVVIDVFEPGQAAPEIARDDGAGQGEDDGGEQANAGASATSTSTDREGAPRSGGEAKSDGGAPSGGQRDTPPEAGQDEPESSRETEAAPGDSGAPTPLIPGTDTSSGDGAASESSGTAEQAAAGAPSIRDSDEAADSQDTPDPQQFESVQPPSAPTATSDGEAVGRMRMRYTPELIAQGLAPKAGEIPRHVAPTRIELPWAGATAAVFRRAGSLFLIAEGAPPTTFPQQLVDAAEGVSKVEQSLKGDLSVVRMHTTPEMGARLLREGDLWRLSLRPRAALPAQPLTINAEEGRVLVPSNEAGQVVEISDPGSGSPMFVATLGGRGQGLALEKRFQEFSLMPTTQGVVVLPLAGYVKTEITDAGVVVRGEGRSLAVSRTDLSRSAGGGDDALNGTSLLDLPTWRRPDKPYDEARQALQKAVADAAPAKKHLARLDLARFFFAHGLATEALGALRLYSAETPRRESDPQVQLMKGASHLLAGHWQPAGRALAHPALDGVKEALPWRAAQAMAAGNDRAALAAFERSRGLLDPYPPSVRKQLRLWAAETYLRIGNIPRAEGQLDALREQDLTTGERAEVRYLTGRRLLLNNQADDAEEVWREVSKDDHPPTRARARFVMIERDLAAERITRDEAIQKLERLRFAWRGDEFEAVLLDRLADLYLAGEEYRPALETLEQAASHLPNTSQAKQATDRMRKVFADLFLDGTADTMSPIKALALYEDFRELTPPGERGNQLIAELADRLVQVDLLSRAADLLDGQVRHRLDGEEKAASGARLASIYLLDRAPEEAIEALNVSRRDNLPGDLRRKRRYLRARALLEAGRHAAALTPVSGDDSPEALRIRAKIHAEQGDWAKASDNLAALLPNRPEDGEQLSADDASKVMRQAVALTLAGNREALGKLRRRYRDALVDSGQQDTFDMLTEMDAGDPSEIGAQLAQVQRAKTFVSGFLSNLRQQASLGQ